MDRIAQFGSRAPMARELNAAGTGEFAAMLQIDHFPLAFPSMPGPFPGYDPGKPWIHLLDSFHYGRPKGATGVDDSSEHHAIDLMTARGTPVRAAADGVVVSAGWNSLGGWSISIMAQLASGRFVQAYYAHLCVPAFKHEGEEVHAGDLIGLVGNTGGVAGAKEWARGAGPPHLHFALYHEPRAKAGRFTDMRNPYRQLIAMTEQALPNSMRKKVPLHAGMPTVKPYTALEDIRKPKEEYRGSSLFEDFHAMVAWRTASAELHQKGYSL
jgi:hypothetical protein